MESVAIGSPREGEDEAMDWMSIVHVLIPTVQKTDPSGVSQVRHNIAFIVDIRITYILYIGEVRKPRPPGRESIDLFLGSTINIIRLLLEKCQVEKLVSRGIQFLVFCGSSSDSEITPTPPLSSCKRRERTLRGNA